MADLQPSPDYQSRTGLAILTGLLTLLSVYVATDDTTPPQPPPKPSSWYVVQDGAVVKAPEIIAVAEKLKPGTYEVTGFPDEGKITRFSVVVSDGFQPVPDPAPPKPEPPKPPEPQPPQPKPIPAILWGVVVEETSERTPQQAAVLTSQTVRSEFANGKFRVIDKDTNADTQFAPYVQQSTGKTLPTLWLVDAFGKVYFQGELPKSESEMIALVRKVKAGQ